MTLASSPPPSTGPTRPDDLLRAAALIRAAAEGLRRDARRARLRGQPRAGLHGRPPNDATLSGAQLRRAREAAGLSQRELARELSYGRGLIADVEGGRRSAPHGLAVWARRVLAAQPGGVR